MHKYYYWALNRMLYLGTNDIGVYLHLDDILKKLSENDAA